MTGILKNGIYGQESFVEVALISDALPILYGTITVASETGTSDTLSNLTNSLNFSYPFFVTLKAKSGHTITVTFNTGNVKLNGGANFSLTGNKALTLLYDPTTGVASDVGGNGASGSGTVTSVALSLPSIFTVSGSPVTTTGTLTGTLATQTANTLFAGPTSGGAATPAFRAMVAADIPTSITLTTPTIASFANAAHTHQNAAGGGQLSASSVFNAGQVPVARGGTNADLSATGGTGQFLKQLSSGATITVATIGAAEVPNLPASIITSGQLVTARGGTGVDLSAAGGARQVLKILSAGAITAAALLVDELPDAPMWAQCRATLTSGTAVTTSDVSGATNLYLTPYEGSLISIYNGTRWLHYSFSEITLSLAGLTTTQPYDVFVYDNAGTLTLEATAWTNNTTRATAIVKQNGQWVKSGATARMHVATIRMSATGQTDVSVKKVFVQNTFNRLPRELTIQYSANDWTYNSTTWRSVNADDTQRFEFVRGFNEEPVFVQHTLFVASGTTVYPGIALDANNVSDANIKGVAVVLTANAMTTYNKPVAIGYHYLQMTERLFSATSSTIWGDNNEPANVQMGATGTIWA